MIIKKITPHATVHQTTTKKVEVKITKTATSDEHTFSVETVNTLVTSSGHRFSSSDTPVNHTQSFFERFQKTDIEEHSKVSKVSKQEDNNHNEKIQNEKIQNEIEQNENEQHENEQQDDDLERLVKADSHDLFNENGFALSLQDIMVKSGLKTPISSTSSTSSTSSVKKESTKTKRLFEDPYDVLCLYCESNNVHPEKGCFICQDCNAYVGRYFETGAEWTNFNNENSKSGVDMNRCGMAINEMLPETSMCTVMGYKESGRECNQMRNLRRYHNWGNVPYKERKLFSVFDDLQNISSAHGIVKNIIDDAKSLYKKFTDQKIGRGDNRTPMIAASLYSACKVHNVSRSANEIAEMFKIDSKMLTRSIKTFQQVMNMSTVSSSGKDFVPRFCCMLMLSQEVQDICRTVVCRVEELDIASDNTPPSLAISVIFFCANKILDCNLDRHEVAEKCGISEITIAKCCHKLEKYSHEIFDDSINIQVERKK